MNNNHMTLTQNCLDDPENNHNLKQMASHSSHSSENPIQPSYPSKNSIQPPYQPECSPQTSHPFETTTQVHTHHSHHNQKL